MTTKQQSIPAWPQTLIPNAHEAQYLVKAAETAAVRIATLRGRHSPGGCRVFKPNLMRD